MPTFSARIIASAMIALVSLVIAALPVWAVTPFYSQLVDGQGSAGGHSSLTFDASGNPHISYFVGSTSDLYYATRDADGWVTEVVDGLGGFNTSIVVDDEGNPHISYYEASGDDLKYATKTAGIWMTEIVDATGNVGTHTSIALDSGGDLHISYYDITNGDLKYAVKTSGSWGLEIVDAGGDVGSYTSLALDGLDNPHIGYYDVTNQDLKYAVKASGAWVISTVDNTGDVGSYASIDLDAQGNPHISYFDATNWDLEYATKATGAWLLETVDGANSVGQSSSMVVGSDGQPHVSYFSLTNNDLKYATRNDSMIWVAEIADGGNVSLSATAIALDFQGNPHVTYSTGIGGGLTYASSAVRLTSPTRGDQWYANGQGTVTWEGVGSVDILLSSDGGATYTTALSGVTGGSATISVPAWSTNSARVRIVRVSPLSSSDSGVFTITDVSVSHEWWVESALSISGFGRTSIDIDGRGTPHVAFLSWQSDDLNYTVRRDGVWMVDSVDTSGVTGHFPSIAVNSAGEPHISYYDVTNVDLEYAYKSGGSWTFETVTTTGGSYTSLALDSNGDPHISYYRESTQDVLYAFKAAGSWSFYWIHGSEQTGPYSSIALDSQDRAHIGYYNATNGDLWYALQRGTLGLTDERVDTTGTVGEYVSIALDPDENPHISYYDVTNTNLKYAVKKDGVWSVETVDASGSVGIYNSIKVDTKGRPYISYVGHPSGRLSVAVKVGNEWMIETIDDTDFSGFYSSLALDDYDNPHISHRVASLSLVKHASTSVMLTGPVSGSTWPVGASRSIEWDGHGVVDISLSVDGGHSYSLLASGLTGGVYNLTVPHTPSKFCKVKVERRSEANPSGDTFLLQSVAVTDSLFTIETSVSLLNLFVFTPQTGGGLIVSWDTDPGPEDLSGYRLQRQRATDAWLTLASRTDETSYHDADGKPGDRYRLFAINGFGDELFLGEASSDRPPSLSGGLSVYPVPFQTGELTIVFGAASVGGVPVETDISIYDVLGRRVKALATARFVGNLGRVTWDGRDDRGVRVASGAYFVRVQNGVTNSVKKVMVVR